MTKQMLASSDTLNETTATLGRRFLLTLLVLILGCVGVMSALLSNISHLREDGQALNIAGRQRALSIAIGLYAQQAHDASADEDRNSAIRKLERARDQLENGFAFLTSTNPEDDIPSQIATYYANLHNGQDGLLDHYLRGIDDYAQRKGPLTIMPEQVLSVLDHGVTLYAQDYDEEWYLLREMVISAIAALVVLVILIYLLVLQPMKKLVRVQSLRMALFGKAVEQSGSMVLVTDPNGMIAYANRRAASDFGYDPEELVGQHSRILGAGQTPRRVHQSLWNTIQQGNTWQGEFLNKRKNGETFWVQATISPICDAKGAIEGYLSIEQDITLFKNALEENEEVREQLLTAIEAVDDAFALFDKDERLILWNSRCQSMFDGVQDLIRPGITFGELLKQGAERGQYGEIDDIDAFVTERLDGFRAAEGEVEIRLANGSWLMGSDRKTADGGRVMLRVDITKMKEVQGQLELAKQEADAANQAKSAFLSSMSHELRTPLNAILGFAQMMEIMPNEPLGKQQERCVTHILKGGKHLLDLINEVLDLAKIEAGKVEVSIEAIDLNALIRECLSLVDKSARDRDITITAPEVDGNRVMVRGDMTRCKQVLLNLLSNAVKYNRAGGEIHVSLSALESAYMRVTVADTGYGIPKDRQSELFQPFSRLGAETSEIEGTGIGLSITKQLVRLMGGKIGFTSQEQVGSQFYIDLQIHDLRDAPKASEAKKAAEQVEKPKSALHGRVLCVEDNPANMNLLDMVFSSMNGVEMIPATTAEIGLDLAFEAPPDLVLMDINLPGMDGFEALATLRANPLTADIPVVAMTANAANNMMSRGVEAGFNAVLIKPMVVPDLVSTVNAYLREKDHESRPATSADL
jgi:PAS domain S-box-containing protein